MSRSERGTRIYVGNLPPDVRERDIEDVFRKYGKVSSLDLRNKKGPPFAFLDFDDSRDAEDAVRGRDGYDLDGYRIRVEFPRSYRDGGRDGRGGGRDRFSDRSGRNDFDRRDNRGGGRNNGSLRRSKYRVLVTGLPPSGSWQDLKDHMREAGDVCYADVSKDGTGVCEFLKEEDMKYAVKKLDDTKFKSHEGETAYIRVKPDTAGRSRSRSASPAARSRSRSPRRSPAGNGKEDTGKGEKKRPRSESRSRSRSASPRDRSKSRTPASRSPSRDRE